MPAAHRFDSVDELIAHGKIADVAINATMDDLHLATAVPLLKGGYDLLLEKPISTSAENVMALQREATRYGRTVLICHVLRYAPFYVRIKERLAAGEIGDIINMQLAEHVSYHHMAVGFVRGKWGNAEVSGSSLLMAKSCHDLDLLVWMKSGIPPRRVTSFGDRSYFRAERAPAGAGTRCLVDCSIESACPYSARKNYIDQDLWGVYAWQPIERPDGKPSYEDKLASLRNDSPFGRCVWHADNTVVDHQSVMVEFTDGATATLNVVGNTAKPCRTIKIVGTKGEIEGVLEDGHFVVRTFDARPGHEYAEEHVRFDIKGEMHGGGDMRLVEDFVDIVRHKDPSISATTLDDSVAGHLLGFAADRSMREQRWIELSDHVTA